MLLSTGKKRAPRTYRDALFLLPYPRFLDAGSVGVVVRHPGGTELGPQPHVERRAGGERREPCRGGGKRRGPGRRVGADVEGARSGTYPHLVEVSAGVGPGERYAGAR